MTNPAQLALLSKLDATAFPPNTIFVFTCNGTDGLEPRFISRCRTVEFSSYRMAAEITAFLEYVWHSEGGKKTGLSISTSAVGIEPTSSMPLGLIDLLDSNQEFTAAL
jgi:hypothetical protein